MTAGYCVCGLPEEKNMKKHKLLLISVSVMTIIVLLLSAQYYYGLFINKTYNTPESSFVNSAPNNSSLIHIVEHGDMNILVFKTLKGEYLCDTIYKTDKGWTSMRYNNLHSKRKLLNKDIYGSSACITVSHIKNKYFVTVCYLSNKYKHYYNGATIKDSINSEFNAFSFFDSTEEFNGIIIFSLVLDSIPNDYFIETGSTRINIKFNNM